VPHSLENEVGLMIFFLFLRERDDEGEGFGRRPFFFEYLILSAPDRFRSFGHTPVLDLDEYDIRCYASQPYYE
jgi:hypothetical protein